MLKLYVVIRATLGSGLKIAQGIHAFRQFVGDHPHLERRWFEESNNIVCVEAPDLDAVADRLATLGLAVSRFHEPDRGGELTAICAEPDAGRWLSHLRLAS